MLSSKDGKAKGGMWGFSDGWVEEEDEEEEEGQKETRPSGTFREMLVHKVSKSVSVRCALGFNFDIGTTQGFIGWCCAKIRCLDR
jgi:hypothetical protein